MNRRSWHDVDRTLRGILYGAIVTMSGLGVMIGIETWILGLVGITGIAAIFEMLYVIEG